MITNPISAYQIGVLTGSFVLVTLILSLCKFVFSKFTKNAGMQLIASYLVSIPSLVMISAYGSADGNTPEWKAAFLDISPWLLIWSVYDLLRCKFFIDPKSPSVFSLEAFKRFGLFVAVALPVCLMTILLETHIDLQKDGSRSSYETNKTATPTDGLAKEIAKINKSLPINIDEQISAQRVSMEGDNILVYHFKVSNKYYSSPAFKNDIEENGIARMIEHYCFDGAPKLKKIGTTVINRYVDDKDNYLTQNVLDTASCAQEYLAQVAKEYQDILPIQQDEVTTLIDMQVEGKRNLVQTYVVPSDFYHSPGVSEEIARTVPANMKSSLCADKFRPFRSVSAEITYRYLDETGNPLTEHTFDVANCES